MEWSELVKATTGRPGMWVGRPYIDGVLTLWHGFAIGSEDHNFERFCTWLACERYPAGEYRNNLAANHILRRAVTGATTGVLSEDEDLRAVDLLAQLVAEFEATNPS